MKKNQDRKYAEQVFLKESGRITNKKIAKQLGVHPATISHWKRVDEWDLKLIHTITDKNDSEVGKEDFLKIDMKHLNMIDERIQTYLQNKDLSSSDILELSQVKLNLISCIQVFNEYYEHSHVEESQLHKYPASDKK